jgi:hypothetical protein
VFRPGSLSIRIAGALAAVGAAGCNAPPPDFIGSDPCPFTRICISCGRVEVGRDVDVSLRSFRPWAPPDLSSALLVRLDPGMSGQEVSATIDGRGDASELPHVAPFGPYDHVLIWDPPLREPDSLVVTYEAGDTPDVDVEVIAVDLACEIARGLTDASDVGS